MYGVGYLSKLAKLCVLVEVQPVLSLLGLLLQCINRVS
jgi:hypothetical protein